jgi:hypothetical protein
VYTQGMLSYNKLKDRPRDCFAATGVPLDEFQQLLLACQGAYAQRYPYELTRTGTPRQRRTGGGAKGVLQRFADKFLFILVYPKTHPRQTMHTGQLQMRQPPANSWIQQFLPVLHHALADVGHAPERDASRLAPSPLALEGTPATALDGTERRRQRPTAARLQQAHYSGKQKPPPAKNLLLVNETTSKVVSLGPPSAGRTHAKKAADEAKIASPTNATLDQATGLQGEEPEGVLTQQPTNSPKARRGAWETSSSSPSSLGAASSWHT